MSEPELILTIPEVQKESRLMFPLLAHRNDVELGDQSQKLCILDSI